MSANDKPVLIYGTFADAEEARRIGADLVDGRLAPITSLYVWQGERQEAVETPMLIKTLAPLSEKVIARVRALHSYDNPALLIVPVVGGSAPFLAWIGAQTASES